jgi:outer membrane protein assembly factor BamB
VLDARTGTVLDTLEDTRFASEILVDAGRLHAVVDRAAAQAGRYTNRPEQSVLTVALDSGEAIWEKAGLQGIEDRRRRGFDATLTRLYITSGGGRVFVLEDANILALDAATGSERWRVDRPEKVSLRHPKDVHPVNDPYDLGSMLYADGVLFFWQPHLPPHRGGFWQYRMELVAISASNGEVLWKKICGGAGFSSFASVYKAQGLIWVQSTPQYVPEERVRESYDLLGLDPRSGEVVKRHSVEQVFQGAIHHHRCYQNKATEKYITYSRNGVDFVDLESGDVDVNKWVRGMCQYGIMPANGLLYAPPQPCACFPSARSGGYHAFAADSDRQPPTVDASDRLLKGEAHSAPLGDRPATGAHWPTYRHDAGRSGATGAKVSWQLEHLWSAAFDEPITAPTVAQGKVFVATQDSHRVCAVDEEDGSLEWTFWAGNRVDSPPTVSGGRVYFGTADGHVYCLRAADGALAWRFDANPQVRHIVSHGRLESTWPIHGSVLVRDHVVYFAAGRSSYLDGGLRFFALNADTGEVVRSARYLSAFDEQEAMEKRARGTFNDILVADGGSIFLKNVALDADTVERKVIGWSYIPISKVWPGSPISAVGGFLDDNLFDRVGWILDYNLIAKMMVYNDDSAFGMKWRDRHTLWHGNLFHLDKSSYMLFGRPRRQQKSVDPSDNSCSVEEEWVVTVPARVTAMTLTDRVLFFAGQPWTGRPDDDAAALLAEEKAGLLGAVDPADGESLARYQLPAAPAWDGMAAAPGRLYISTRDGQLLCMGNEAGKIALDMRKSVKKQ